MPIRPLNGYLCVKPYTRPASETETRPSSLILHTTPSKATMKAFEVVGRLVSETFRIYERDVVYVDATYTPKTTDDGHMFIHVESIVCLEEYTTNE
jgi:hypothetical protein